jgi:uncharacterized membrane protein YczE
MSKKSSRQNSRNLTEEEKELGKKRIYIIIGMIIIGLAVAMYNMQ